MFALLVLAACAPGGSGESPSPASLHDTGTPTLDSTDGDTDVSMVDSTPQIPTDTGDTHTTEADPCGALDGPLLAVPENPRVYGVRLFQLTTEVPSTLSLALDGVALTTSPDTTVHDLPLLGMRPGTLHEITWTANCEAGTRSGSIEVSQPAFTLPWPDVTVLAHEADRAAPGFTLIDLTSNDLANYVAILHPDGEPAWVLELDERAADARLSEDGRVVVIEGYEIGVWDIRGVQIARYSPDPDPDPDETFVDTYGFHHDVMIRPDGSLLTLSSGSQVVAGVPAGYLPGDPTRTATLEDPIVVEVHPDGTIATEQGLLDILSPTRIGFQSLQDAELGLDWGHANAVIVDEATGDRIVSARHQDAVVRFSEEGEIRWILANHEGWPIDFHRYLLTPDTEDFAWPYHQHAAMLHPSGDGRVLMFDNGNNGRVTPYSERPPEGNYSRIVEYQVVDGTVSQTWEYVDTRTGPEFSSAFGDADYLDGGRTILGVWGFLFKEGGVDNQTAGLGTKSTRLIEIDVATEEVVWELRLASDASDAPQGWQVHRAQRLSTLY